MLRTLLLSIAALFVLDGCRTARGDIPTSPSMNARRYANLEKQSEERLGCTEKLKYTYLGENMHRMSGCAKQTEYLLYCVGGSCHWIDSPAHRAEHDLGCPAADVNVVTLSKQTRGVSGCGKKTAYVLHCIPQGLGMSCDWLLNGPIQAE